MTGHTVSNPIYERLTRGSRGPSKRSATWIGVGITLAGSAASLLPMLSQNLKWEALPAVILSALTVLVAVLSLFAGLALASGVMSRLMTGEDWALLRLTSFPADKIESGCVAGVGERLRLLHTIGLWALPAGLVGWAYSMGYFRTSFDVVVSSLDRTLSGVLPALAAISIGMVIFQVIWRWCIRIGVWLALWLGERALPAGAAVAVVGVAAFGVALVMSINLAVFAVPVALIGVLSRIARNESIWIIQGPDDSDPDDLISE